MRGVDQSHRTLHGKAVEVQIPIDIGGSSSWPGCRAEPLEDENQIAARNLRASRSSFKDRQKAPRLVGRREYYCWYERRSDRMSLFGRNLLRLRVAERGARRRLKSTTRCDRNRTAIVSASSNAIITRWLCRGKLFRSLAYRRNSRRNRCERMAYRSRLALSVSMRQCIMVSWLICVSVL